MADKDDIDYKLAQREIHDAINELRKVQGLEPLPLPSEGAAASSEAKHPEYCSFCGKTKDEVQKLVAGPSVFICDKCVTLAHKLLKDS